MPGATPAGGTGTAPAGSMRLAPRDGEHARSKSHGHGGAPCRGRVFDHGERVRDLRRAATSEHLGQALGGEVVVRGAEAAADDEHVRLGGEGVRQRRREPLAVVGHREQLGDLDAAAGCRSWQTNTPLVSWVRPSSSSLPLSTTAALRSSEDQTWSPACG